MAEGDVQSSSQRKVNRSFSMDQACIFEMDGVDLENFDNEPIPDNDDFNDDDNDDDKDDGASKDTVDERGDLLNKSDSKSVRQFATSLPIQVPLWKTSHFIGTDDDDDDNENITCDEDPNKIAESFRALAWSVKDGTEMFGALPRRRLNTGDLVKSRPI